MTALPHQGQPVLVGGTELHDAVGAVIMVHGRGGTGADMLALANHVARPGVAFLAPQAAGNTWYPHSFLAPVEQNQPGIASGFAVLKMLLDHIGEAGIGGDRTILLGFSQGACLALEYAARYPRRLAGIVGLSGGLIGPPGTARAYEGSLERSPVFLGCSDVDPHIPCERVAESADVFRRLDADVTERIYPGMGHTVNPDEIRFIRGLVEGIGLEPAANGHSKTTVKVIREPRQ